MKKNIRIFVLILTLFSSTKLWASEWYQNQLVDIVCKVEDHFQIDEICIKQQSRFRADVMEVSNWRMSLHDAQIEYFNSDPVLFIPSSGDIVDLRKKIFRQSNIDFELSHCNGQLEVE